MRHSMRRPIEHRIDEVIAAKRYLRVRPSRYPDHRTSAVGRGLQPGPLINESPRPRPCCLPEMPHCSADREFRPVPSSLIRRACSTLINHGAADRPDGLRQCPTRRRNVRGLT